MSGGGLAVASLSAGYGRRRVIEALTLPALPPGELSVFIGPNAAGKSTLMRAIAGLLPVKGRVLLGDTDLGALASAERARLVTYMPQDLPQRVALTVVEATMSALRIGGAAAGNSAAVHAEAYDTLERLGLTHLALEPLDRLSGGQRQLASLAQALVRAPRVMLLDEPTSALDLNHQHRVMELVRTVAAERGLVAVMVLHDVALACRWADRIVVMHDGAVYDSGPAADCVTPRMLADVYAVEARVEQCSRGVPHVVVDRTLPQTGGTRP